MTFVLTKASCTLIAAPAGLVEVSMGPLGHSGVATLEKGETIGYELRLAVTKMAHGLLEQAHLHRLNVSLH